ncbi:MULTISPECIES: hypothetical protein [Vibrio]|uniref:hypothetical protein n=1 Tax=Vibrio TaxID=662 RepID=UPI002075D721|nr:MULTISPECIES: hypothetical protein [Vibrio]USD35575.1 hypothetical protein J8Z27_22445 [Vibrio sp. SCSIO 43186]USD72699.1 hypothetical protein J4N41_22460 [Vibrio sp. SCSIO 43139]USD98914.1 hypothetical protein CTT30_22795 [Vibrio coralliilyticus]
MKELSLLFFVFLSALSFGVIVVIFMRTTMISAYEGIFGALVVKSWQKIVSVIIVVSSLSGGISLHYLERYIFPVASNEDSKEVVHSIDAKVIAYESLRAFLSAASSVMAVMMTLLVASLIIVLILKVKEKLPKNRE